MNLVKSPQSLNNKLMEPNSRSLNDKLNTLAAGQAIGLTPEEAAIYGVDYADELPEDEDLEEEVEDGD